MKTIYTNLTNKITELKQDSKYNMSRIMRRARYIYLTRNENFDYFHVKTWSDALKQSWLEAKKVIIKVREELKHTINSLANRYNVQRSPEFKQNELNEQMLSAYNSGAKMN